MEGTTEDQKRNETPQPLTDREQAVIKSTWAKVYENKEAAGVSVLIRLFTNFPSSRQYFNDFQHLEDIEDMKASTQLKKHSVRVMNALNTLVENVHDGEKNVSVLTPLAKSHALKHKVDPVYFKILAGVILEVLVETFPETFVPKAQEAWSKLMDVIYWHVNQVYSEIGWESNSTTE